MEARMYTAFRPQLESFDDDVQDCRVGPYNGNANRSRGFVSEVFMPSNGCIGGCRGFNDYMHAGVVAAPSQWGQSSGPSYAYNETFGSGANDSIPAEGRFSCYEIGYGANEATMIENFGVANQYLHQLTLKLFNGRVIPDKILYGIVYFDAKDSMRVNRIKIKGNGTMLKMITHKKETSRPEVPTNTFTKEVVTSGSSGTRNQNNYNALTRDFSGSDLYERLNCPVDLHEGDENLKPFSGPINLKPGTHAIPFAVRIPASTNPTITYERDRKKMGHAKVQLLYTIFAEVDVQATNGGNATIISEKVPIQIVSCAGLPHVVTNQYLAGDVQLVDLPDNSSKVLLITEKKHLQSPDTIRLYVYTDKQEAVHSVFCELIQSSNLPELDLSDDQDVKNPKKEPGLELLYRTKKVSLKKNFPKKFTSKVGDQFPPDMENYTQNSVNPNLNDLLKMPENMRKAGCLVEIPVKAGLEPNIEAGDTRIRYHLRIHLDVKKQRKPVSPAGLLTISEELLHNYKIRYIKFTDQ